MRKIGKYFPVLLASDSTNIRIIHNSQNQTLEIHGPPSAKGDIIAYFSEIENLLQGGIPPKMKKKLFK